MYTTHADSMSMFHQKAKLPVISERFPRWQNDIACGGGPIVRLVILHHPNRKSLGTSQDIPPLRHDIQRHEEMYIDVRYVTSDMLSIVLFHWWSDRNMGRRSEKNQYNIWSLKSSIFTPTFQSHSLPKAPSDTIVTYLINPFPCIK